MFSYVKHLRFVKVFKNVRQGVVVWLISKGAMRLNCVVRYLLGTACKYVVEL